MTVTSGDVPAQGPVGHREPAVAGHPPTRLPGAAVIRLLLVEDDPGDALLVRELLADSALAVDIHWVRELAEARRSLVAGVHCVLFDLGLPDAEGLAGLRSLIQAAPAVAVLVLTGLADEHLGAEAVSVGAQDYLVKGQVEPQLLARSIRYAIERKRADESLRRLYQSELRAQENARLERGLLPQPQLSRERCRAGRATGRAGRSPCSAATSSTSWRRRTACAGR